MVQDFINRVGAALLTRRGGAVAVGAAAVLLVGFDVVPFDSSEGKGLGLAGLAVAGLGATKLAPIAWAWLRDRFGGPPAPGAAMAAVAA